MSNFDMSGFLAEFFDEANARLQSINQKLVLLEAGDLGDNELIQLRRDVHTIKGSAQMLGVQDVSELCHVFEDVMHDVTLENATDVLPMIQFLFDLHDCLQSRLQHRDAKIRVDCALKRVQFEQLKKTLQASFAEQENIAGASDKSNESDKPVNAIPKKPARRKRKSNVAKNLIAAVMGSFEESLQQKQATTLHTPSAEQGLATAPKTIEPINFRPNVAALDLAETDSNKASGNFLRVYRNRLTNLSSQIVELASLRFRHDAPEQQLQRVVRDFRQSKDKLLSNPAIDASAQNALQSVMDAHLRQIQQMSDALRQQQQRSSVMLDGVRDQVLDLMLKPLSSVFSMFPRALRDVCKRSGKKVQLLVAGDSVEMDQLAAEALTEPLLHLINNAVAHGIEKPNQRLKCGKPLEGQITIYARQQGNLIHLDVTDDGKGMDVSEIRQQAILQGIVSRSEAEDMDSSEILELIFRPGFSTQKKVTALAGRGMGMSVVLDVMRELTGNIHIHSEVGQGTRFSMVFPVSLTVQQATMFRIGQQRFGMLANLIVQVMPLRSQQIKTGSGPFRKGYIHYQGHRVPIIDLHHALGSAELDENPEHAKIVVVEHLEGYLAMVVDEMLGDTEVMLRELDAYLKYYHPIGLMGCSIIDDGSVQLLIDPNGLKEMWRTAPDDSVASSHANHSFKQHILLVDDSTIALTIEKKMFEQMGFKVDTAIGGNDALEKVALNLNQNSNQYDLMITDLEMPDINGIALIHRLRDMLQDNIFPIIMVATRDAETERQRAYDAGANGYIAKDQLQGEATQLVKLLTTLLHDDK